MIFFSYFRSKPCVANSKATNEETETISLVIPANVRICIYQYEIWMDNKLLNYVCKKHQITDCEAGSAPDNSENYLL